MPLTDDEDGTFVFDITEDDAGTRVDKWLSQNIKELTRSRLKALIDEGALSRNGETFKDASYKLRAGEHYRLVLPPVADPEPEAEPIALDVVFEDEHLIVINKPAGLVVHPGAGNWTGTLVNALIHHCGDSLSGIGGVARPGIVHRIDKDTSGLLVVAKSDAAHQKLAKAFEKHNIERLYEAVAIGAPRPGFGTIDLPMARNTNDRKKMATVRDEDHPNARRAVTHYKVVEVFGRNRAKLKGDALASRVECTLETGRTHQIRLHLSTIGHPLVGDQTYGRGPGLSGLKPGEEVADLAIETVKNFRRQALHARVLGFDHPITGDSMRFEQEPPQDFNNLIDVLRGL
ncbi:RluA family pseudouridine synthase [Hyphococcus sp. DH-69]|uniref:RluA family pseudouridine synthase n=1 Tax=Hyphococcus formosus TaxID=3143534 RepID=UPI00398ABDA6